MKRKKISEFFHHMNRTTYYTLIACAALCAVLLLCVIISEAMQRAKPAPAEVPEQLAALEKQDAKAVEKEIKRLRVEAMLKKAEHELSDEIDESESGIWAMFDNYVFMGDSRCVGFSYYKFLRDDRVFAAGGNTIRDILTDIDKLKKISPATLYLCYGLNDTGIGYWESGEAYGAELADIFDTLQKELPDTMIVASSILPATEAALEKNPVWRKIPDFDKALQKVCAQKGVVYVDNSALVEQYMDSLYDDDGVHLRPAFYPMWAKNLYIAALMAETEK